MKQFEEYNGKNLPYSAMSVCYALLNCARTYATESLDVDDIENSVRDHILVDLINYIGVITTKDFQIQTRDFYHVKENCIAVEPNLLLTVLWNYGSYFLNLLHPHYQKISSLEQAQLLGKEDIRVIQSFMNDIANRNQIDRSFSKEEIYQRVYDLQVQKQKH